MIGWPGEALAVALVATKCSLHAFDALLNTHSLTFEQRVSQTVCNKPSDARIDSLRGIASAEDSSVLANVTEHVRAHNEHDEPARRHPRGARPLRSGRAPARGRAAAGRGAEAALLELGGSRPRFALAPSRASR